MFKFLIMHLQVFLSSFVFDMYITFHLKQKDIWRLSTFVSLDKSSRASVHHLDTIKSLYLLLCGESNYPQDLDSLVMLAQTH